MKGRGLDKLGGVLRFPKPGSLALGPRVSDCLEREGRGQGLLGAWPFFDSPNHRKRGRERAGEGGRSVIWGCDLYWLYPEEKGAERESIAEGTGLSAPSTW